MTKTMKECLFRLGIGTFCLIMLISLSNTSAQSDPCSLSAVLSSYQAAALSGDVQTWAQGYLERGCSEQVEQGIRTLVQAYEEMTQEDVILNEPETPFLTSSGTHVLGQPWEQDGVSLNLIRLDIRSANGEPAAAQAWFRFFNFSGQRLLVDIDWSSIYLEDSLGTRYGDWDGGTTSAWVETGSSYNFNRYYTISPGESSRVPSQAEYVQMVIERFSRFSNVRWQYEINPTLSPISPPLPEEAFAIGQSWIADDISLTLNNLEVRSGGGEPAATRAWFSLTNQSNTRRLVEIDFSHIFIVDGFGRRFIDWDGGGINSVWLDPRQSYEFDRYYSEMAGVQSRVTRGSEFVLVVAQNMAGIPLAQWRFDIVR